MRRRVLLLVFVTTLFAVTLLGALIIATIWAVMGNATQGRAQVVASLAAQGLQGPPAVGRDDVGRARLEADHQRRELVLVEVPGQPGEPDDVGEPDRLGHRLALPDRLRDGETALEGRRELSAPPVDDEALERRQQHFELAEQPGRGVGRQRVGRVDDAAVRELAAERVDLPAGQAAGRAAERPHDVDGRRLVEDAAALQRREQHERIDVLVGERRGVADVGEPHRAPQRARLLQRHAGPLRHVVAREPAGRPEDDVDEVVDDLAGVRLLRLLLGHAYASPSSARGGGGASPAARRRRRSSSSCSR